LAAAGSGKGGIAQSRGPGQMVAGEKRKAKMPGGWGEHDAVAGAKAQAGKIHPAISLLAIEKRGQTDQALLAFTQSGPGNFCLQAKIELSPVPRAGIGGPGGRIIGEIRIGHRCLVIGKSQIGIFAITAVIPVIRHLLRCPVDQKLFAGKCLVIGRIGLVAADAGPAGCLEITFESGLADWRLGDACRAGESKSRDWLGGGQDEQHH